MLATTFQAFHKQTLVVKFPLQPLAKLAGLSFVTSNLTCSNFCNETCKLFDNHFKNYFKAALARYSYSSFIKVRNAKSRYINGHVIKRVDSFCHLGIVFKYNNTVQLAIKNNVAKAKRALFKSHLNSGP